MSFRLNQLINTKLIGSLYVVAQHEADWFIICCATHVRHAWYHIYCFYCIRKGSTTNWSLTWFYKATLNSVYTETYIRRRINTIWRCTITRCQYASMAKIRRWLRQCHGKSLNLFELSAISSLLIMNTSQTTPSLSGQRF